MNSVILRLQKGLGLIEVLVTVVIVSIGLLALASFQGNLLFGSADNKARSEARALAETKIEELRSSIEVGDIADTGDGNTGYLDIAALTEGTYSDIPTSGTNALFIRTWEIEDMDAVTESFLSGAPPRKRISVEVCWPRPRNACTDQIYAVSEIAWIDPQKSLLYSAEASGAGTAVAPSPRQNASEDVREASETVDPNDVDSPTETPLPFTGTRASTTATSFTVTATDGSGTYTATQIAADSNYYNTPFGAGVLGVYLCVGVDCTYVQNHFGGVSLSTAGTVYSTSGLGLGAIRVAWTSSDVTACYNSAVTTYSASDGVNSNFPGVIADDYAVMDYECVYAGNCDATGAGLYGCSASVSDSQIAARSVGPGGEYGDVGLLGTDDQGGDSEQVCFLEDASDYTNSQNVLIYGAASGSAGDEDYILPVTKRLLVSRRQNNDGTQSSEGINRSFRNHNFLIIDRGNGPATKEGCYDEIIVNDENLAAREIVRTLSSDNVVASTIATYSGSAVSKTLTGTIVSNAGNLLMYIDQLGTCYVKNDSTSYACAIPSNVTDTVIQAGSSTLPANSTTYAACTALVSSAAQVCTWPTSFP